LVGNALTPQIEVTCVFISKTLLSFYKEQKVAATMKISALSVLALATSASAFVSNTASSRVESRLFERRPYITGNWKLNPSTRDEAVALAKGIADSVTPDSPCDVALFVPFPFIEAAQEAAGDKLTVGAEVSCSAIDIPMTPSSESFFSTHVMHSFFIIKMVTPEIQGAFTGGISAGMLKSIGVQSVLAGHSERRTINEESDEYINAQCLKLIEADMNVILCIGETDEEFEKDLVAAVCEVQLKKGLAGISAEDMSKVTMYVIA
jgi:triosephosphate isomerase